VNEIDERHVDIDDVAIGRRAHLHLTGNEVKNGGVADQRPVQRLPQQRADRDRERHVQQDDECLFAHQRHRPIHLIRMVLNRHPRCTSLIPRPAVTRCAYSPPCRGSNDINRAVDTAREFLTTRSIRY